jgi:hypothetical protein
VFTRTFCWSLSWARSIQSIPPHRISLRSILILSSYLSLGFPNGIFPFVFLTKSLYTFVFVPMRGTCLAHLIFLDFITLIWRGVQVMMLLIMQFSSGCYYFIPLGSKYSP